MKGWFDAFRDDGAPTLYSFSNRTPVIGDISIIVVFILFTTLYTAFLVIFPGVRKQVKLKKLQHFSYRKTCITPFAEIFNFYHGNAESLRWSSHFQ